MTPSRQSSACCGAPIVDALSLRNIEEKEGQTNWMLCSNCHKPCDPPANSPAGQKIFGGYGKLSREQALTLSSFPEKAADYILRLQTERDTLLREHGELRNLHIVLAHMQYSSHEQFLMMVGRAESLLSSIPSRSSPAV